MIKARLRYYSLSVYSTVLLLAIFLACISWLWFFTIDPLLVNNRESVENTLQENKEIIASLKGIKSGRYRFFYEDQIQVTPPETIVRDLVTDIPGVTLVEYQNLETQPIVENYGGHQVLNLNTESELVEHIDKKNFQVVLTGNFGSIKEYLKEIYESGNPIFWERISYEVTLWPEAKVTLDGFVLRKG